VVGIEDAAQAMLAAADRGRIGERYIISDRYLSVREINGIAAAAVGRKPAQVGIPLPVLKAAARLNDLTAWIINRDLPLAYAGIRMAELMSPLDHSKAERELGWTPRPVEESIREAAQFFAARRRCRS
jgi:dihydroflavonol-4-reductase